MKRVRTLLASMALAGASPALADCTVSVIGPAFGTYDPFASSPLDAVGSIRFSCTSAALVTISTGSSGSYSARTMLSGSSKLPYNLYRDAAHTSVWGDWTGGSTFAILGAGSNQSVPIYARIPPSQDVAPGTYSDTLMVTFYF